MSEQRVEDLEQESFNYVNALPDAVRGGIRYAYIAGYLAGQAAERERVRVATEALEKLADGVCVDSTCLSCGLSVTQHIPLGTASVALETIRGLG